MYDDSLVILGLLIIALMNTLIPATWLKWSRKWDRREADKVPHWQLITIATFMIASAIAAIFLTYAFALSLIF